MPFLFVPFALFVVNSCCTCVIIIRMEPSNPISFPVLANAQRQTRQLANVFCTPLLCLISSSTWWSKVRRPIRVLGWAWELADQVALVQSR